MALETIRAVHYGKLDLRLKGITANDEKSSEIDLWAIEGYPLIAKVAFFVIRTVGATDVVSVTLEFSMDDGVDWVTITSETETISSVAGGQSSFVVAADKIGRYVRIKCPTVGSGNTLDAYALIA